MIVENNTPQNTMIFIPCAECGQQFAPSQTKTKICLACIATKNNITDGLPKSIMLPWCKYCGKFFGKNWILCSRESRELLAICLKKINGLNKLKMIDAKFIWTEEHSRRIKVQLVVQKEITKDLTLQQNFIVEFYEVYTQCDDCKKQFTPHTWKACVQVRQKVQNKKTFLYLEQVMLKNQVHKKAIDIKSVRNGMNFFFKSKPDALKLVDFLNSMLPHINKESKELVSHDVQNSNYNYKFTFYFELPKICKNDLVKIPTKLAKEMGGVNSLGICYKITDKIHMFDPITMKKYNLNSKQYFNFENDFTIIPFRGNETEFYVTDIEKEERSFNLNTSLADINIKFARISVARNKDHKQFEGYTHLGHILKHGDSVLGYDLTSLNQLENIENIENQKYLPDIILIRKFYNQKKRIWKIKRMEIEDDVNEEEVKNKKNLKYINTQLQNQKKDMEEFIDEIEQDKFLRSKMNLYMDKQGVDFLKTNPDQKEDHEEMVQLTELMKDLKVKEEKNNPKDFKDLMKDLEDTKV